MSRPCLRRPLDGGAAMCARALLASLVSLGVPSPGVDAQEAARPTSHYFVGGQRVELTPSPAWLSLGPVPGVSADALALELSGVPEWRARALSSKLVELQVPAERRRSVLSDLREDARMEWAEPGFSFDGRPIYLAGQIVVQLAESESRPVLDDLVREHGVSVVGEVPTFSDTFRLTCPRERELDVLDLVEICRAWPGIAFAEPVFYWNAKMQGPNDPLFPTQWPLRNTGQGPGSVGADIDAEGAWETTIGSPGIVVAIIDDGVDVHHPDLASNLVAGMDATGLSSPDGIPGNASCGDAHGTACAGIVSALQGNGLGVSGVAPGCRIMPVRGFAGILGSSTWLATGINWAWQNGADVLSNSWGGGAPSNLIDQAIGSAGSLGRGGLGCVTLFAAGNDNCGSLSYPASHPETVAVGASSPCDERKSAIDPSVCGATGKCTAVYLSCDGECHWGSNFGDGLDLIAPGVLVPTTDHSGVCGYTADDYTSTFNGTSAACPHAAAAAALVLSVAPGLTREQVRAILRASSDDLEGPGWDPETGYGRLNVARAVQLALETTGTVVWVDASSTGVELGTEQNPFTSLGKALQLAPSGGTIRIAGGVYPETPTIDQAVTLEAHSGTVIVGD